jgi:hypothetical protein
MRDHCPNCGSNRAYVSASKLSAILDAVARSNVSSSSWLLNINLSDEQATGVGCEALPLILTLRIIV